MRARDDRSYLEASQWGTRVAVGWHATGGWLDELSTHPWHEFLAAGDAGLAEKAHSAP